MHVGDEIIQSVAALVSRRGREGALVARIGGDRFAVLVPGCGIEPAARIAEELRSAAIRLSGARGDKPLLVSLSIGVSRIGERDRRLDHAIAGAELACRSAKERGRNRVEIFYGNAQTLSRGRRLIGPGRGGDGGPRRRLVRTAGAAHPALECGAGRSALRDTAARAGRRRLASRRGEARGRRGLRGTRPAHRSLGDRAIHRAPGRLSGPAAPVSGTVLVEPVGRFAGRRRVLAHVGRAGTQDSHRARHLELRIPRGGGERAHRNDRSVHVPVARTGHFLCVGQFRTRHRLALEPQFSAGVMHQDRRQLQPRSHRQCEIAIDAGGDHATREDVRSGDRGGARGDRRDPCARRKAGGGLRPGLLHRQTAGPGRCDPRPAVVFLLRDSHGTVRCSRSAGGTLRAASGEARPHVCCRVW